MIRRTLVPVDLRPVRVDEARKPPRRLTTSLDERTVVPTGLSSAPPLDGKTSIPAHLPLGVLVERTLVPRGMEAKPLEKLQPLTESVPLAILDSRVVVPAYVEPPSPEEIEEFEHPPEMTPELQEIVEPDIFTTGMPNLLVEAEVKRDPKWDLVVRALSVAVHIGLVIFLISTPKLFPPHTPTREEIELARRQLSFVYMPPDVSEVPKVPVRPSPPSPKIRISPDILKQVAPPREESQLRPEGPPINPLRAPSELPEAPRPQPSLNPESTPSSSAPAPSRIEPVRPPAQQVPGRLNLQIPQASPGKLLQDQLQDAVRRSGGSTYSTGAAIPRGPGGGGGGQGYLGNQVQILTPTEGVDFTSYITRLLAAVKRNWYAVIPESARMGDRGIVVITFHINRDGNVPFPDPNLVRTSGKEPLDTAAMAAIRASSPFEPLPQQFSGPYIELKFIFLYNLPLDYIQ